MWNWSFNCTLSRCYLHTVTLTRDTFCRSISPFPLFDCECWNLLVFPLPAPVPWLGGAAQPLSPAHLAHFNINGTIKSSSWSFCLLRPLWVLLPSGAFGAFFKGIFDHGASSNLPFCLFICLLPPPSSVLPSVMKRLLIFDAQ